MIARLMLFSMLLTFLLIFQCLGDDAPILIESVRSMSMGGTSVGIADDETLFFFNPAILSNAKDSKLTAINPVICFNIDAIKVTEEFISSYDNAGSAHQFPASSINKLNDASPLLSLSPFKFIYTRPNIAVAFLNTEINMKGKFRHEGERSSITLSGHGDEAAMLALAGNVFKGLSVGGTIKYLTRFDMRENDAEALLDHRPTILMGQGLGLDLGILWKVRDWSLGLSIRDALSTKLVWNNAVIDGDWVELDNKSKTKIDEDFTFGVSYNPDWKLSFSPDIPKDLILAFDMGGFKPLARNLHFGMEAKIFRWLALRIGINTGLRLGVGLKTTMWVMDFMYATKLRDDFLGRNTSHNICLSFALSY